MTVPWQIRAQCDEALAEYERRLRHVVRAYLPEMLDKIPAVVPGDVDAARGSGADRRAARQARLLDA